MSDFNYPPRDELESMTDSELVEHGVAIQNAILDANRQQARLYKKRQELIRDILKARVANRKNGLETNPNHDDFDGDLTAVIFPSRAPTTP